MVSSKFWDHNGYKVVSTLCRYQYGIFWRNKCLEKCPQKPFICMRYLDDIFIIWHHGRTAFSEFIDIFYSSLPLCNHLVSNPNSHSTDTSVTHDDTHFTLTPIELIKDSGEPLLNTFERLKRESYWMVLIGTIKPYGLNTKSVDLALKYQPPFQKILPFVVITHRYPYRIVSWCCCKYINFCTTSKN